LLSHIHLKKKKNEGEELEFITLEA